MTPKHYALVGCGASKLETPAPAEELYDSIYFEKKRAFADVFAIDWWIVSAEHGLVAPETVLDPYDTTIEDVDIGAWLSDVRADLQEIGVLDDEAAELWVLVGQRYLDAQAQHRAVGAGIGSLRDLLGTASGTVRFPFAATSGIGDQMGWLSECVEEGQITHPGEDSPDDDEDEPGTASLSRY